jgi:hypothetical protein
MKSTNDCRLKEKSCVSEVSTQSRSSTEKRSSEEKLNEHTMNERRKEIIKDLEVCDLLDLRNP